MSLQASLVAFSFILIPIAMLAHSATALGPECLEGPNVPEDCVPEDIDDVVTVEPIGATACISPQTCLGPQTLLRPVISGTIPNPVPEQVVYITPCLVPGDPMPSVLLVLVTLDGICPIGDPHPELNPIPASTCTIGEACNDLPNAGFENFVTPDPPNFCATPSRVKVLGVTVLSSIPVVSVDGC